MLLHNLTSNFDSLLHLERYVNKGSPSGFTYTYAVSERYDPRHPEKYFELPCINIAKDSCIFFPSSNSGSSNFFVNDKVLFPVHPDMLSEAIANFKANGIQELGERVQIKAAPTASMRTVLAHTLEGPIYIKLHYNGIIGRINRGLPLAKAKAGVEITNILKNTTYLPQSFSFFPEETAISTKCAHRASEFGVILRNSQAYPTKNGEIYLIPFFSLTSKDLLAPNDPFLLPQICDFHKSPLDIFEKIISLVIESYLFLVFENGLIPEINAQNILLEVNEDYFPQRIVLKDLMGWEKDLTIRDELGLSNNFASYPYKCIKKENGKIYYVRHSFSYDFKLGHYIFNDLIDCITKHYSIESEVLYKVIRNSFAKFAKGREFKYFRPWNKWYSHPKCLLTKERPYLKNSNPKARSIDMSKLNLEQNFADKPPCLRKGDVLGILTPSEPITEERWGKLQKGISLFESLGFKVRLSEHLRDINFYMAGTPQDRAADFDEMLKDKEIRVIWTSWGGKSSNQILPLINWDLLAKDPKIIIGFSDTTTIINAAYGKTNIVSFYGPHIAGKIADCPHDSIDSFMNAFMKGEARMSLNNTPMTVIHPGRCTGRLVGGNLKSFILSNLNTNFEPELTGSIFFWETGSGTPQEIDQFLTYLDLSGVYNRINGMVVGDLSNCKDKRDWGGKDIYDVVKDNTAKYKFPVIHIDTFGHGNITNLAIPVGCMAEINTESNIFSVTEPCVNL